MLLSFVDWDDRKAILDIYHEAFVLGGSTADLKLVSVVQRQDMFTWYTNGSHQPSTNQATNHMSKRPPIMVAN
jgi:L-amino acid N-acyltransferase YncA